MNAIHIAGTKGKGSTSAFISSILVQYLEPSSSEPQLHNVGLYTSPHLRYVRERIQLNNAPLTEEAFASSFFEIWDRFEAAASKDGNLTSNLTKPVYFRFLTLMAFHAFLEEKVDAAVIECGIGGEYDSTNILTSPSVVGITSLGIDHTAVLGSTIEEIAWHKAGIMKPGIPAFTVPQPPSAMEVLRSRAREKGVELRVVERHPEIDKGTAKLGLATDVQKTNASLAVEIAAAYLRSRGHAGISTSPLPSQFLRGLETVVWSGRCETRHEGDITWHIDGGHTTESIRVAGQWFADCVAESNHPSAAKTTSSSPAAISPPPSSPRILLFNQQTRAGPPLLRELHATVGSSAPFTHAIFCTNVTFAASGYRPDLVSVNVSQDAVQGLEVQRELAVAWRETTGKGESGEDNVFVVRTIEEAVAKCREIARAWVEEGEGSEKVRVLATGSVHLVGGLLDVLETEEDG